MCAIHCRWSVAVALWLIAFGIDASVSADDIPSIHYRYEGYSTLTGSPIFSGPKTDYFWGEFDKDESVSRYFRNVLYPSDPSNSLAYRASIAEHCAIDGDTVITCQKSVERILSHAPRSLNDAKLLHKACFTAEADQVRTLRYFKKVPQAAARVLRGDYFLGMTPDGPIRSLSDPSRHIVDSAVAYEHTSSDGTVYRFVFKKAASVCSRFSLKFPGRQAGEKSAKADPYTHVGEVEEIDDGFVLTSVSTQNPSGPNPQITETWERISEFAWQSKSVSITLPPDEGDRIDNLADPQIKFEWREGEIVKAFDPVGDRTARLHFARSSRWFLGLNIVAILAVVAVIIWRWRSVASCLLVAFLSMPNTASASDAYCGVYSLYGAAKSLGIDADLEKLIDAQYISSVRGSTADDLVRAARAVGLEATPLRGLGIRSLRAAKQPLILHAAPLGTHAVYQHWILFLGFNEDGKARVLDGAGGVAECSIAELLARWDGIAVAIRSLDSVATQFLSHEVSGLFWCLALGGVCCLLIKSDALMRRRSGGSRTCRIPIHLAALVAASFVLGYASKSDGFSNAAKGINSALGLSQSPHVNLAELLTKIEQGAVLIDCRYEHDYELGHIEDALSVPIDCGLGDFKHLTTDVDRNADVIVYCQSAECHFSDMCATMLTGAGFTNVSVFVGGYEAWKKHVDDQ